jgi:hypothetical protein
MSRNEELKRMQFDAAGILYIPGHDPVDEGAERRFFRLTLTGGTVVDVHCDYFRISDNGLLTLYYWMGPDEPTWSFEPHSHYAPGSWVSLVQDRAAQEQWYQKQAEESAKWRAEREGHETRT